jgi:hypothetical protein
MIYTIFSHRPVLPQIIGLLKKTFPKSHLTIKNGNDAYLIELDQKKGLFRPEQKLRITYRQRKKIACSLPDTDDSPLTAHLKSLFEYAGSLPSSNEKVKQLLLQKIPTVNSEFSIHHEAGDPKDIPKLIRMFAAEFDAFLLVQPGTVIGGSPHQHFLDKDLRLILDPEGNCDIEELAVVVDEAWLNKEAEPEPTENQQTRKSRSEEMLRRWNIPVNGDLPCTLDDSETTLHTSAETAQRLCVLTFIHSVAHDLLSNRDAMKSLKAYGLWEHTSSNEKLFLVDPTEERKSRERWRSESVRVLLWALEQSDDLPIPGQEDFPEPAASNIFPIQTDEDPHTFLDSAKTLRAKEIILDMHDLYYRLARACAHEKANGRAIEGVHPEVVHERFYALSWLSNYRGQSWDKISEV